MSSTERRARHAGATVALVAWAALSVFPLYWMLLTAFSPQADTVAFPPHFFPRRLTLDNFAWLFSHAAIGRWFVNSLAVAASVTAGSLLINAMAGYAFAKMRFPHRELVFWMLLSLLMVPEIVMLIPLYVVVNDLWLSDTFFVLIVPFLASVWGIFLIKQFLQTLPDALLEAARIDGASEWLIFRKIVLPLAKPVLGALGTFTFVGQWNSLLWWLLFTSSAEMRNVQVGLASLRFQYATLYGPLMAGALLAAIPMIVVFFAFQRSLVRGLTIGALKG
ncbi:MAG: carbohydrate ABC transporter permease [Candidatus Eremiobacter antarcticus]|nr:carbohydrate ABC transporter permease [Candidatus Eremiobacteraeota bacterium]MBC5808710.1 carbohydrate ABC transporter permease [Candidatus Eremiobacteraeota bacterium]